MDCRFAFAFMYPPLVWKKIYWSISFENTSRTNIPLQIYGNIFDSLIDELSEMEKKKREKKECIFVEIFLSIFFSRISIFVVSYPTKLNLLFYMLFI